MNRMNNSETENTKDIDNMLRSAYSKAVPSSKYREKLLGELKQVASTNVIPHPLLKTTDWMIIAAVIITFIIIYGMWLPQQMANTLLP